MGSTFVCFLQHTDSQRDLSFLQSCLLENIKASSKGLQPQGAEGAPWFGHFLLRSHGSASYVTHEQTWG